MLLGGLRLPQAASPEEGFEGARWIWFSREPMPISQNFPAGVHYFRGSFALPAEAKPASAQVIVAADNLYSIYVNGQLAGESEPDPSAWNRARRFEIAPLLRGGTNWVAVEAMNTAAGPAGLLVKTILEPAAADQAPRVAVSDEHWKCTDQEKAGWEQPEFDDSGWRAVHVVGEAGVPPWGKLTPSREARLAGAPLDAARKQDRELLDEQRFLARHGGSGGPRPVKERTPPPDYPWPEAVVFLAGDCSLYRPAALTGTSLDSLSVTIFNPHHTRAFPEHDLPSPVKTGRRLMVLAPARPDGEARVLLDAGSGGMGSPTVSFDGRTIYFALAAAGDGFFHLYRLPAQGGELRQLTRGPFHDLDPVELPDGRIAFVSTRSGTFEEYHNPPSRGLFALNPADGRVELLTATFIFDNEPEVLADGRILFIRSDNFFDRGKVETLLHAVHPDGTGGYTEFGLDLGPEYGGRLRAFNCGSPAPLPDGRVAFVTGSTIALGRPGAPMGSLQQLRIEAGDVAALPDGRLLCTLPERPGPPTADGATPAPPRLDYAFDRLAVLAPDETGEEVVVLHTSKAGPIHSPVYLGQRPRAPKLVGKMKPALVDEPHATGLLFCQDARFTRKTAAGWRQVRAMRVLAGRGLTVRSSHSYIVHAGSEVIELGTVPLAPDGSFAVEVPADTAIAFQAVDAEGRSELNEMSWIYVRPGESRGCVGCHQPRQSAPLLATTVPLAMRTRPLRLLGRDTPPRFRGNNAAVTGLMELQFDRYREVAGINRHADTPDPQATGLQELADLIQRLQHPQPARRLAAIQHLALFRDSRAAPALAQSLQDSGREIRVAAAVALATCGTRASADPLLEALADPEPLVAQAAALALENLTGCALPFQPFGEDLDPTVAAAPWKAWFQTNSWEAIEGALVRRLEGPDRDDVRRAAVALGHVGQDAARAALRRYVAREREHNPYPAWRVDHQGDGALFNAASPANPRTLQAATRALGYLQDTAAAPLLAETLQRFHHPPDGNLFLAEAAAEALGRIGAEHPAARRSLATAFAQLGEYPNYTRWYGDHDALIACHASPIHYYLLEAMDAAGATDLASLVPHWIRSVPTDPDRALLLANDDYEVLVGRLIRRSGAEGEVTETCLALLGDPTARRSPAVEQALVSTHAAWAGKPDPENRAAQILSLAWRSPEWAPRVQAAFLRYSQLTNSIPRVFDTGIPVVTQLPVKHWVSFYLARALGHANAPDTARVLLQGLARSVPEGAHGYPDPLGPGVLFLHNDLTPCWRAAVAWALGRSGHREAVPVLLELVQNLANAPDTRHAAAEAIGRLADARWLPELERLARDYPEVATRRALRLVCAQLKEPVRERLPTEVAAQRASADRTPRE